MKTSKAKLILITILLMGSVLLTGCASLNNKFDCSLKPGVMCKSIDQVNTQVDQGVLGGNSTASTCKKCNAVNSKQINTRGNFITPSPNLTLNPGDPIRYGETVMRVWMAPFEDKDGNYYQPTVLYTVIKPGHWMGQPVKAITDEGDNI